MFLILFSKNGLFQNVVLNPVGNRLIISVVENPIISNVDFEGNKIFKDQFLFSIIIRFFIFNEIW